MDHRTVIATVWVMLAAVSVRAQEGAGHALRFDGAGDNVLVPHTNALNAFPLTVTCWLRTTQSAFGPGVVNKPAPASPVPLRNSVPGISQIYYS
jgi:hypothetical protein